MRFRVYYREGKKSHYLLSVTALSMDEALDIAASAVSLDRDKLTAEVAK